MFLVSWLLMRLNIFARVYQPFVSPLCWLSVYILCFFVSCVVIFLNAWSSSLCVLVLLFYWSYTMRRSPSLSFVLYFVYGVFWCTDKFNFDVFDYFTVFIICVWIFFKKIFPTSKSHVYFPIVSFFLKVFQVLSFTLSM